MTRIFSDSFFKGELKCQTYLDARQEGYRYRKKFPAFACGFGIRNGASTERRCSPGKMGWPGPGLMAVVTGIFFSHAFAADPELKGNDIVNPVNTAWTLIAAFLVFGMQVGFTMLEAGFCRSRETVNVLVECVVDTCLCGILFYAVGFAFMFAHGNGFIGYHWFFLQNAPATYETTGVAFLAVWIFQFAFADTCSTITSGAMIGRTGFRRRPPLQHLRYWFHLSGHRPLGLGSGRLAGKHGQRRPFLARLGNGLP